MTETVWGALFFGYILIAAVPLLIHAGEFDAVKNDERFERAAWIWSAGLVALAVAYAIFA